MKRIIFLAIIVIFLMILACGKELRFSYKLNKEITIMRGNDKTELTGEQFLKEVADTDVVFVGEIHSDSVTHIFELELLKNLHTRHAKMAVALEMFERDVQEVLDKYLEGSITEKEFLEKSRPWGNYNSAYKPLIEFARENDLPVLAMNVPRRYAKKVAMWGEEVLAEIPDSEKVWIADKLRCPDDSYKKKFIEEMSGDMRPSPMTKFNFDNLYKAQCLKDDTMAESISDFLARNPDYKIISYQGSFHVAYGLGLAEKLKKLKPNISPAIAICIPVDTGSEMRFDDHQNKGDYLVFVSKNKKSK